MANMGNALFGAGTTDDGRGLEAMAEDGDPAALGASSGGGVFAVPSGAAEPGPLFPGSSYSVEFDATADQYLSFATMFVQSYDWFFGPVGDGMALFDASGNPISGDITSEGEHIGDNEFSRGVDVVSLRPGRTSATAATWIMVRKVWALSASSPAKYSSKHPSRARPSPTSPSPREPLGL